MLNVFKQNDYEKLEDHFEEPLEVTNINATGYQVDSDSDGAAEHMFDYESVQDDETLAKLEKEKRDKSAALHTTGVLMALFAGALYGLQSIIVKQAVGHGIPITQCLLSRSIFQVISMPIYGRLKGISFTIEKDHRWKVFWISLFYSIASSCVFTAFSLILPDAAVAARSGSRTICAILFTLFVLKETFTLWDFGSLVMSILGIFFMFVATTQLNEFYVNGSTRIVAGFCLCFAGGLSIKQLVHAENIVFWHAVQSCIINIPALFILQKPVLTDFVGLRWLTFLCLSATSATLLSNTALQFTNPGMVSMAQSVDLSVATIIEHVVFLERAPRMLEELGAGFIMLSGCLVPLVKFCTRDQ